MKTGEVNRDNRMQEIFGIEPGTFNGSYETWKGLVHPDDLNMAGKATMHSVETGESYECEYRVKGEKW
ncbi:MAG: PAS domain-containing protein [Candidatus Anammoxibacter sp.]